MKSRQAKLNHLSTNNKSFVSGSRIIPGARQDLTIHDDVLDNDVRLEKVRKGHHAERNAVQYGNREVVISAKLIEESRNGYVLTAGAPHEINSAVKHYTGMLRKYTLDFPEEVSGREDECRPRICACVYVRFSLLPLSALIPTVGFVPFQSRENILFRQSQKSRPQ